MENEIFDDKTVKEIIGDMKKIIKSEQTGQVTLNKYISEKNQMSCMDFAMVYEGVEEIKNFINEQRAKGVKISIGENAILIN